MMEKSSVVVETDVIKFSKTDQGDDGENRCLNLPDTHGHSRVYIESVRLSLGLFVTEFVLSLNKE